MTEKVWVSEAESNYGSHTGIQVEKSALASDKALRAMMREMQELYAQAFCKFHRLYSSGLGFTLRVQFTAI